MPPKLKRQLRRLVEGREPWPLFLFGIAGTGKTCAALCLLDCIEGTNRNSYLEASELATRLVSCMRGEWTNPAGYPGRESSEWALIEQSSVAVLDELGARNNVSDHHYETVKKHLDTRAGRPAIYIANLGPAAITKIYDDRVSSRLCAGTVFELDGEDRRLS